MMPNLNELLDNIKTNTNRLNDLCDAAAETIKTVEKALVASNFGFDQCFAITFAINGQPSGHLTWGKGTGNNWRINVVTGDGSDNVTRPWAECGRDLRLLSFKALPALLIAMANYATQKADDAVATVEPIIRNVRGALDDIGNRHHPHPEH